MSDSNISLGSVATHFRCGGIFSDSFITSFVLSDGERMLKIGQYLAKLFQEYSVSFFLTHGVYIVSHVLYCDRDALALSLQFVISY